MIKKMFHLFRKQPQEATFIRENREAFERLKKKLDAIDKDKKDTGRKLVI